MPRNADQFRLLGLSNKSIEGKPMLLPEKAIVMVAALTLQPLHIMSRQAAATFLFEEASQEKARTNLRQLISRVKRSARSAALPISISKESLTLTTMGKNSDLSHFLTGLDSLGQNQIDRDLNQFRFLEHYTGELLQGIEVAEIELERWVAQQRRFLEDAFLTATKRYFEALTYLGRCDAVHLSQVAARVLRFCPNDEEALEAVIKAYSRSGSPDLLARARGLVIQPKTGRKTMGASATDASKTEEKHIRPGKVSSKLPSVAMLAPEILENTKFDWILQAFVADVANVLSRFRSFQIYSVESSFQLAHSSRNKKNNPNFDRDYTISSYGIPGESSACFRMMHERTGRIVWSAEYSVDEENLRNTFNVLSKHVAQTIGDEIERHRSKSLRLLGCDQSYLSLLQGNKYMNQSGLPALRRARKAFSRAHELAMEWSEPLAKIAQTHQLEWLLLGRAEPELLQVSNKMALSATDLDPYDPMAHWMLGVTALYQRNFESADTSFREAECLAPNNSEMLLQYADAKSHYGEIEDSWRLFNRATLLNPLAPDRHWWVGAGIAFVRGELNEAISLCHRMNDIDPALRIYTASLALLDQHAEARSAAHRLMESYPGLTAAEIVSLIPDRDKNVTNKLEEGLKLAGVPER